MSKRGLCENTESAKKIPKLSAFGFGRPTPIQPIAATTSNTATTSSSTSDTCRPATKPVQEPKTTLIPEQRSFKNTWKFNRPWLRFDSVKKAMFCDVCIQAQVNNVFTTGCNKLKKESVTKHTEGKGNNSHARALETIKSTKNMEKACEVVNSKQKNAIISALRDVYWIAVHDISNSSVPSLNIHSICQGNQYLEYLNVDKHTTYSHASSIKEFQSVIAQYFEEKLINKIKQSEFYSILVDESTDISVHQNLMVYIRIIEEEGGRWVPRTYFLGLRQIARANAENLTKEILSLLENKGLSLELLSGIASDGASVMVGCKSGVVTRLKNLCSGLLSVHCIAHRLALGCASAADEVVYLATFQEHLNSVYSYFSMSPKQMSSLEHIQKIIDGSSHGRFHKVFHIRWLSFEGSVRAIVRNYSALLSVFMEENSGKSLSLHKPVSCYKFLYCAHFLSDVLKELSVLCKFYQKSDINYSDVNPKLLATISAIEDLRDRKSGAVFKEFLKVVPVEVVNNEFELQGHMIRDNSKQRREADKACSDFVTHMVDSLKKRFTEEGDSLVLSALSSLFSPGELSEDHSGIVREYVSKLGIDLLDFNQEVSSFRSYVRVKVAGNIECFKTPMDIIQLCLRDIESYPIISGLAKRFAVMPVSTADVERGFSRQNLIKTAIRNRLGERTLENLLRISIDGHEDERNINFPEIFKLWAAKPRRILQ